MLFIVHLQIVVSPVRVTLRSPRSEHIGLRGEIGSCWRTVRASSRGMRPCSRIDSAADAGECLRIYDRFVRTLPRIWTALAVWAPPVVLGGLALFEIWVDPFLQARSFPGPEPVYTVSVLVMVAGLAVRTRAPGLCLAAVLLELVVEWSSSPQGNVGVSSEWFVAMLVAYYSVGAHCELRAAVVCLAASLPVTISVNVANVVRYDDSVGEVASVYPFVFVLWGAGVAARRLRHRATDLEDRVVALARERDEKARAAVAHERARIARELHDVVTHSVTTMVLQAAGARGVIRSHPERADAALQSTETTGRQALRELRRMLGILRTHDDSAPVPQPGLGDVDSLVDQMRDAGLPVRLDVEGPPLGLAPGVDLAAYRIVQEALTNVLKHAGPVEATVLLRYARDELELVISNAGPVTHGTINGGEPGQGLIGMRERVALYGGMLRTEPDPAGGFTVRALLPLEGERL
jgi:signal transduction histidine kinase